jgi:hypothetical protein
MLLLIAQLLNIINENCICPQIVGGVLGNNLFHLAGILLSLAA